MGGDLLADDQAVEPGQTEIEDDDIDARLTADINAFRLPL
jgi:hypothetical protein